MALPDLSRANWRKSTRSNGGGECVEIATAANVIAIRDSKTPDGPKLILTPDAWRTFSRAVQTGQHDL